MTRQPSLFSPPRTPSIRPRFRPPPALELRTHIALADVLDRVVNRRKWIWTHLPFGGKRSAITGALLKRMGVKPGWPDFVFISWTGAIHFLELKRGSADLNDHQQAFFAAMRARNIECKVARSYEEAIRILAGWGVVPISVSLKEAAA